jgi:NAD(P)H dehydrogenase (quinone)
MSAQVTIAYYSTYQHVYKLAQAVKRGAERVENVKVDLYQIPETLSEEILAKMHAPSKPSHVPEFTIDAFTKADGILFGIPTRFGFMPAQLKTFFDSTGSVWTKGGLRGKLAGIFFSTNTQHGGQESTAFTTIPFFAHHGMTYVPFGNGHPSTTSTDEVIGGGPWGAGTVAAGEGERPSPLELEIAEAQGEQFARQVLVRKLGEAEFALLLQAQTIEHEVATGQSEKSHATNKTTSTAADTVTANDSTPPSESQVTDTPRDIPTTERIKKAKRKVKALTKFRLLFQRIRKTSCYSSYSKDHD